MKTYKVWIHLEEIDESKDHYLNLGLPYEAGRFNTEAAARKFVESELMITERPNVKLRNACQRMLDTLNIGGEQARQFAEEIEMLKDALKTCPMVKNNCSQCGAGSDEREFIGKDFLGIGTVHVHYMCNRCGSRITEEFTLTNIFADNGR